MGTFVIVLLIVLLLFSDRLADTGKGLGEAVKNFKRSVGSDDAKPGPAQVSQAPPKLLPAKGETSSSDDESKDRKA